MATTPSFTTSIRGVDKTYSGGSIEDYTITTSPIAEQVPDQYGAIACEMVYDHRVDLSVTMHAAGATAPTFSGDTITFDSVNYHVDSVAEAGSYQNVKRWTVTAHRFDNTPSGT
jgi:hypothetical protein